MAGQPLESGGGVMVLVLIGAAGTALGGWILGSPFPTEPTGPYGTPLWAPELRDFLLFWTSVLVILDALIVGVQYHLNSALSRVLVAPQVSPRVLIFNALLVAQLASGVSGLLVAGWLAGHGPIELIGLIWSSSVLFGYYVSRSSRDRATTRLGGLGPGVNRGSLLVLRCLLAAMLGLSFLSFTLHEGYEQVRMFQESVGFREPQIDAEEPTPEIVPPEPVQQPPPSAPTQRMIVIERDDSFWSIAGEHCNADEFIPCWLRWIESNRDLLRDPTDPNLIYPADVLRVPEPLGEMD